MISLMAGQAARLETTEDPFAHKLMLAASGSDVAAEVIHGQEGHEVVLRGRLGKIIPSLSTESLDCQVVAERVETDEDWQLICQLGFDAGQGHFLGRPRAGVNADV